MMKGPRPEKVKTLRCMTCKKTVVAWVHPSPELVVQLEGFMEMLEPHLGHKLKTTVEKFSD